MSETGAKLIDVPSLDALAADPSKAATLSPETAQALLCSLAGVLPLLIAQSTKATGPAEVPSTSERLLTVDEVLKQYGVKKQWLYRHKKSMPYSQPSQKVLLFPEGKLAKWFANQKH